MSVSIPSDDPEQQPRRRGDRQRKAILGAVRELLQEVPFDDLSVSTISDRAGVARSGFYFYFDSKYAVLAQILAEAQQELEELTHHFAPREPDEQPAAFARRMVQSAAVMFANNDPVMSACTQARATDAEIRRIQDEQISSIIAKIVKIVEDALAALPGLKVIWMQLGVRDDAAAARAEARGVIVVQDRCPKIEARRLGLV